MTVLLPDTAYKIFSQNTVPGEDSALTDNLNHLTGNLPYLCHVKETASLFTMQKPYSGELKDQLLWDSSECSILECSASGSVFYIMLNSGLYKVLEKFTCIRSFVQ